MPDDLYGQLNGHSNAAEGDAHPCCGSIGFEADDVLATLAVAFAEKGHEVAICTSDKDCRQLINEKDSPIQRPQRHDLWRKGAA